MRALVFSVLIAALAACDEDPDARKLSELGDPDHVATCQRTREQAGADALSGLQAHACFRSASALGACNMTIFSNCVSQPLSPCLAPASDSPLRTCGATVSEYIQCEVAMAKQFLAYRGVSCASPPTTSPQLQKDLADCSALCRKCPSATGCQ